MERTKSSLFNLPEENIESLKNTSIIFWFSKCFQAFMLLNKTM